MAVFLCTKASSRATKYYIKHEELLTDMTRSISSSGLQFYAEPSTSTHNAANQAAPGLPTIQAHGARNDASPVDEYDVFLEPAMQPAMQPAMHDRERGDPIPPSSPPRSSRQEPCMGLDGIFSTMLRSPFAASEV